MALFEKFGKSTRYFIGAAVIFLVNILCASMLSYDALTREHMSLLNMAVIVFYAVVPLFLCSLWYDWCYYKKYELESGEPEARVFFVPSKTVKNFKLIGLTFKSSDDEGNIVYDQNVLYQTKTLTPKKPLLADVHMFGTIPNLGISYVDDSGRTHKYIVHQSGEDGSLLLTKEDF